MKVVISNFQITQLHLNFVIVNDEFTYLQAGTKMSTHIITQMVQHKLSCFIIITLYATEIYILAVVLFKFLAIVHILLSIFMKWMCCVHTSYTHIICYPLFN